MPAAGPHPDWRYVSRQEEGHTKAIRLLASRQICRIEELRSLKLADSATAFVQAAIICAIPLCELKSIRAQVKAKRCGHALHADVCQYVMLHVVYNRWGRKRVVV